MASAAFAVPILPGKTDKWRERIAQLSGERKKQHEESRKRVGIDREFVALQETPIGHMVVIYLEGADPMESVRRYIESGDEFDRWFAENILKECHGVKDADPVPDPTPMVDWKK